MVPQGDSVMHSGHLRVDSVALQEVDTGWRRHLWAVFRECHSFGQGASSSVNYIMYELAGDAGSRVCLSTLVFIVALHIPCERASHALSEAKAKAKHSLATWFHVYRLTTRSEEQATSHHHGRPPEGSCTDRRFS